MNKLLNKNIGKILLIAVSYCFFQTANGASFDCNQVNGFVETTICASPELSELDDTLAHTYEKMLAEADQPALLQKEQRIWLIKNRAICVTSDCLEDVYKKRIEEIRLTKKFQWKSYTNTKLGVRFSYPSNRKVQVAKLKSLKLTGFAMDSSEYIIEFEVGAGNFEKAIEDSAVFEKRDGIWAAAIGPSENSPAEKINTKNWTGIKSKISCGISDKETGFHAAGGECLWAVLSNGKQYVIANTQGILGLDDITLKTLMSIEFLK